MQRICLDQNSIEVKGAQQLLEDSPFVGFAGDVSLLGESPTQLTAGTDRSRLESPAVDDAGSENAHWSAMPTSAPLKSRQEGRSSQAVSA